MLSFSCQKNPLSLSIILLLEVLYTEQPDDGFLNFFLLIKCASRIMVLLVPVNFMFIQEILVEGFVLKKNFSNYSYVEAALTTIVRRELSVYYVPLDFFAQSNSIHFWKPQSVWKLFRYVYNFFFIFFIFSDYNLQVRTK